MKIPQQTSPAAPTPIRELLAKATPGKWTVTPIRSGDKWIEIEEPAVRVDYDDVVPEVQEANAQLIARLSPEVVMAVVEYCEDITRNSADGYADCRAKEILSLLNGEKTL